MPILDDLLPLLGSHFRHIDLKLPPLFWTFGGLEVHLPSELYRVFKEEAPAGFEEVEDGFVGQIQMRTALGDTEVSCMIMRRESLDPGLVYLGVYLEDDEASVKAPWLYKRWQELYN